jgi:hypothetical protein
MMGFELAGRIWSQHLRDSITVNIHVGMSNNLPMGVIGGALPGITPRQQFSQFYQRYSADIQSADDQTAFANLPVQGTRLFTTGTTLNNGTGDSRSLTFGSLSSTRTSNRTSSIRRSVNLSTGSTPSTPTAFQGLFDVHEVRGGGLVNMSQITKTSETLNLSRANAKALGLLDGQNQGLDGYILMSHLDNQPFTWSYDYTRSQEPASNTLDFLSTALHEIGHVLGFISGIDRPGWLNSNVYSDEERQTYINSLGEHIRNAMPLDFFRLSPTDLWMNMTFGGNRIFSLDRGASSIAQFATGKDVQLGGDGFQASHWTGQNVTLGIMNPTLAPEQRVDISQVDLRALDVIGYDRATNQPLSQSALFTQVQQAIAQRLGQSVSWVTANAATSPQQLTQDRSQHIQSMVQGSEIYEWGTTGSGKTSVSGRRWMEIFFPPPIQVSSPTSTTKTVVDVSNNSTTTSDSPVIPQESLGAIANSYPTTSNSPTTESIVDPLHRAPLNLWSQRLPLQDVLIQYPENNQVFNQGNVTSVTATEEAAEWTNSFNFATPQFPSITSLPNAVSTFQAQRPVVFSSINSSTISQSPTLFSRLGASNDLLMPDVLGSGLLTVHA